jgi:hypothetical protein
MKESKMNTQTRTTQHLTAESAADLVNRYIAIWNERDSARRRALIAKTWTEEGSYLDPLMSSDGHAGIDAMIQAVQERFAGFRFHALNNVDAYSNRLRFSWELAPEGGAMVVAGSDFATIAADGRLQAVIGFLDHMPATNA